jgi:hypothetical protein
MSHSPTCGRCEGRAPPALLSYYDAVRLFGRCPRRWPTGLALSDRCTATRQPGIVAHIVGTEDQAPPGRITGRSAAALSLMA